MPVQGSTQEAKFKASWVTESPAGGVNPPRALPPCRTVPLGPNEYPSGSTTPARARVRGRYVC